MSHNALTQLRVSIITNLRRKLTLIAPKSVTSLQILK